MNKEINLHKIFLILKNFKFNKKMCRKKFHSELNFIKNFDKKNWKIFLCNITSKKIKKFIEKKAKNPRQLFYPNIFPQNSKLIFQ